MWQIDYSQQALKFITKHNRLAQELLDFIRSCILKLQGEDINIDVKKMKGEWKEYFRIGKESSESSLRLTLMVIQCLSIK